MHVPRRANSQLASVHSTFIRTFTQSSLHSTPFERIVGDIADDALFFAR